MPTNPRDGYSLTPIGMLDDEDYQSLTPEQRAVWEAIRLRCCRNWRPWEHRGLQLPAYSMVTTLRALADLAGIRSGRAQDRARRAASRLANFGWITVTSSANRWTVISLARADRWQSHETYRRATDSEPIANQRGTDSGEARDQTRTPAFEIATAATAATATEEDLEQGQGQQQDPAPTSGLGDATSTRDGPIQGSLRSPSDCVAPDHGLHGGSRAGSRTQPAGGTAQGAAAPLSASAGSADRDDPALLFRAALAVADHHRSLAVRVVRASKLASKLTNDYAWKVSLRRQWADRWGELLTSFQLTGDAACAWLSRAFGSGATVWEGREIGVAERLARADAPHWLSRPGKWELIDGLMREAKPAAKSTPRSVETETRRSIGEDFLQRMRAGRDAPQDELLDLVKELDR